MKVKMFSKYFKQTLFERKMHAPFDTGLEKEINKWLRENPEIKIHKFVQSMSGGFMFYGKFAVTILYED